MRLWSIHPKYLDSKGLVALWREALLAQKVLLGKTRGYKNHPQLIRFKKTSNPVGAIADYLRDILNEANKRGYKFDRSKIAKDQLGEKIDVTTGQSEYEFKHLLNKLKNRDPDLFSNISKNKKISLHPIFHRIKGDIESWEIR